jgi:hypothetical protein
MDSELSFPAAALETTTPLLTLTHLLVADSDDTGARGQHAWRAGGHELLVLAQARLAVARAVEAGGGAADDAARGAGGRGRRDFQSVLPQVGVLAVAPSAGVHVAKEGRAGAVASRLGPTRGCAADGGILEHRRGTTHGIAGCLGRRGIAKAAGAVPEPAVLPARAACVRGAGVMAWSRGASVVGLAPAA